MTPESKLVGPESTAKILARLEFGIPYNDAARAAGIKTATAKHWLAKGRREDSGAYADFAEAVDQARQVAQDRPEPMDEAELAQVVPA